MKTNLNPSATRASPLSWLATLAIAGLFAAPAAGAASGPTGTASSSTEIQCAGAQMPDSPLIPRMRELGLKPGGRIDPATLMQDPELAKLIAQVTESEKQRQKIDWAGLCRYRAANAERHGREAPDVVFLGDSITDNWIYGDPSLFSAKVLDRGISGQTSAQMLLRFEADVISLRPATVHIMAGTNDILQDLGPTTDDAIIDNFVAMLDLAKVHKIQVVIASILPISERSWQPQLKPGPRVVRLNQRLKELALARKARFLDYYAELTDAAGGLRSDLGNDGVHPNRTGYAAMAPLARSIISRASRRQ